jgi:hypothetical protein
MYFYTFRFHISYLFHTLSRVVRQGCESSNIESPTARRAYLSPLQSPNPSHFSMQVSSRPLSSRRPSHSEMRGRAPLPVASGAPQNPQNGHSRNPSALDVARSPPNQNNKSKSLTSIHSYPLLQCLEYELIFAIVHADTKHVPCKFFRQGACQAGPACPFLHSTDAGIDYAPCKYFAKV